MGLGRQGFPQSLQEEELRILFRMCENPPLTTLKSLSKYSGGRSCLCRETQALFNLNFPDYVFLFFNIFPPQGISLTTV